MENSQKQGLVYRKLKLNGRTELSQETCIDIE